MEPVYDLAKDSRLNYKISKEQPLIQVWKSLWEQCEDANEIYNSLKTCFPRANRNVANIMKMLEVFHSEVKKRSPSSDLESRTSGENSDQDLCENCGSSKSKQKILRENYERRGHMIEYLLSNIAAPLRMNDGLKPRSFEKPNDVNGLSVKGTAFLSHRERPEVADISLHQSASLASKQPSNLAVESFTEQDRGINKFSAKGTSLLSDTERSEIADIPLNQSASRAAKPPNNLAVESFTKEDRGSGINKLSAKGTSRISDTERSEIADIPFHQSASRAAKQPNNLAVESFTKEDRGSGINKFSVRGTSHISDTESSEIADIPLTQSASRAVKQPNNLAVESFTKEGEEKNPSGANVRGFTRSLLQPEKLSGFSLDRETESKANITSILVKLLRNFTKYDPSKDPFTNMSVFENECSQHNLGPRESCLMMKLWLPSEMSARLSTPIARPAGGPQFWSESYHWGDTSDRVKALSRLVLGEDNLGTGILEDLTVTSRDDPSVFARKFEHAYRLVMNVNDPNPPPALLKALVDKFNYLDRLAHVEASKEKTIEGIVRLVDDYQRERGLKASSLKKNEVKPTGEGLTREVVPKDEQPMRWRRQPHS